MPYIGSDKYGFQKILRAYCGYPSYLPFPAHMEHGWTNYDMPLKTDLETDKPLMLVFNKRRKKLWKKNSNVPVEVMGSPFIHYKNKYKISKKNGARGTVVFPSHSTFDIKSEYSIEDFIKELKKLPKKYKPITICLFYIDYISDKKDKYKRAGFNVVTAGPWISSSLKFVKNFYEIISSHRYVTSNSVGSYAFYSIDLEIPFFLTGVRSEIVNKSDVNVEEVSKRQDSDIKKIAIDLFSTGPTDKVSAKQKTFVCEEMGIDDCLSPKDLNKLLINTYRCNGLWREVPGYWFNALVNKLIFDMPSTGLIIKIRKKIG